MSRRSLHTPNARSACAANALEYGTPLRTKIRCLYFVPVNAYCDSHSASYSAILDCYSAFLDRDSAFLDHHTRSSITTLHPRPSQVIPLCTAIPDVIHDRTAIRPRPTGLGYHRRSFNRVRTPLCAMHYCACVSCLWSTCVVWSHGQ